MNEESPCVICKGSGKNMFKESCPYCNGTGEWNDAAIAYMNNHICQCVHWDREFCPICKKKCHHNSAQNPNQIIDSGVGGMGAAKSKPEPEKEEEEMIVVL